jgi:hypothetical protein
LKRLMAVMPGWFPRNLNTENRLRWQRSGARLSSEVHFLAIFQCQ